MPPLSQRTRATIMSRDAFCNTVKDRFPDISAKADLEYTRLWDDFTDSEFYSYSWFEALANALNNEMCNGTSPEVYDELFTLISDNFESGDEKIRQCIDVAFVENLFWAVPASKSESYWNVLPGNLKKLYVGFHHSPPPI